MTVQPKTSACKSCGAPIYWCTTSNGKPMPMNAMADLNGGFVLDLRDGELHASAYQPMHHAANRRRWTSHFATCRHANNHRRRT
jgi:hypothetical protein